MSSVTTHISEFVTSKSHSTKLQDGCVGQVRSCAVDQWILTWKSFRQESKVSESNEHDDGFRFIVFIVKPSIECLECMLGCLGAGLVVVPLNWRWTLKDMEEALADMNHAIAGVVVDKFFSDVGKSLYDRIIHLDSRFTRCVFLQIPYPRLRTMQPRTCQTLAKAPNNVAFVIFTSGTGSKPKAAMITHDNIIFQCFQKKVCCGYETSDVYLHMAPLFHVGGLVSALAMVMVTARHVFMPSPNFDSQKALNILVEESCTSFIAVPTMMKDLVESNDRRGGGPLENVKRVLIGAGGLDPGTAARAQHMMPQASLFTAYGMTEACSSMTYMSIGRRNQLETSTEHIYVGEIPLGIHIAVLNDQGAIHTRGKGELVTRGRHVFHSYYERHCAQRRSSNFLCDANGNAWFRTGDLGLTLGNKVWLSGRLKDIIKSGGENVASAEVERVLVLHNGILECSVYAIPDKKWGEAVAAAIILVHGSDIWNMCMQTKQTIVTPNDHTEIYQHIKHHCIQCGLSPYKIPKCLMVCSTAFPRNATGKIIKRMLQQETITCLRDLTSHTNTSTNLHSKL